MIEMIALDLDETLLTTDKQISPKTAEALIKLHEAGKKIVLCTGRPINAIWKYIEQLQLTNDDDYTITFNGALVIQNTTKDVLARSGMSKTDLQPLYDFAKQNGNPLDVLDFEQVYPIADLTPSQYQQMLKAPMDFVPTDFENLPDQDYSKAVMSTNQEVLDEVADRLTPDMHKHYHIVRSQPKIMEFLADGMDKAVGLEQLLDHFDLTFANLMTFGDAENDLGMIEAAGDGVAMVNGTDQVKAAADDMTTFDNNHDGIAKYLKKAFPDILDR
ncbi:Cof-type HAD-IIB family hydrolase [Levilactobacillus bambusae]|uniref:Cof-type HAD-IIB family hydrolase n=1 Tax=Levilactobacillus bambusae TaxID=2024736 RepID=A0A2V1MZ81_9LACO|nr:Cof-type HAD-IIB family hydrolase [Levilactobacillus bambusae]PWG00073.1 Cof-type HAD-IIB family hydrolase [Levilactobacillus bambusae]